MIRRDGTDIPSDAWDELMTSRGIPPWIVVRQPIVTTQRTFLVMGCYRGGTSFAAELLIEAGIHLGDSYIDRSKNDYETYEDQDIYWAINDIMTRGKQHSYSSNEWRYLRQIIEERDASRDIWGFKHPSSLFIVDQLLPLLRNPHLVVVTRDALSTWQGSQSRNGWMTWSYIRTMMAQTLDLIEKPRAPTLAISFERARSDRQSALRAIKQFTGA